MLKTMGPGTLAKGPGAKPIENARNYTFVTENQPRSEKAQSNGTDGRPGTKQPTGHQTSMYTSEGAHKMKRGRYGGSSDNNAGVPDWVDHVLPYVNSRELLRLRQVGKHADAFVCARVTTLWLQPEYAKIPSMQHCLSFAETTRRCTRALTTLIVSFDGEALRGPRFAPGQLTPMMSMLADALGATTRLQTLHIRGLEMTDGELGLVARGVQQSGSGRTLTTLAFDRHHFGPGALYQLCVLAEACPMIEYFTIGRGVWRYAAVDEKSDPPENDLLGRLARALGRLRSCEFVNVPFGHMDTFLLNLTCPDLRNLHVSYCTSRPWVANVAHILCIGPRPSLQRLSLPDSWASRDTSEAQITEALQALTSVGCLALGGVSPAAGRALMTTVPRLPNATSISYTHFSGPLAEHALFEQRLRQLLRDRSTPK